MASLLQAPLSTQVSIVDDQGRPTPQFARLLQKLGVGGGLTTSNGQITLATMAAKTILANKTTSTAAPTACTLSDILDFVSTTQGSILYRGASGWQVLPPGTSGQFLKTQGAGADPAWAAAGGGGSSTYWGYAFVGALNPLTVTGTTTASLGGGTVQTAINNTHRANWWWFNNGNTTATVTFDLGAAYVISGILMFQDITTANGTWKVQYSDDNVTYTDAGVSGAWGGAVSFAWTFTNSAAHRYWRLTQTAGSTSSSPWQQGVMFRWGPA